MMNIYYDFSAKRYAIQLQHAGLKQSRLIRGSDRHTVRERAAAQQDAWDDQWKKQCGEDKAAKQSAEAQAALAACHGLLKGALKGKPAPIWDQLQHRSTF